MVKGKVFGALSKIAHAVFGALGHHVFLPPKGDQVSWALIDKFVASSYYTPGQYRAYYEASLKHTDMVWTDSFWKQCRYYSICQMVEHALSPLSTANGRRICH